MLASRGQRPAVSCPRGMGDQTVQGVCSPHSLTQGMLGSSHRQQGALMWPPGTSSSQRQKGRIYCIRLSLDMLHPQHVAPNALASVLAPSACCQSHGLPAACCTPLQQG